MKNINDTICALITPPGIGAINVIRISGTDAITVCNKIFVGKKSLLEAKSGRVYYGKLINQIDDVLVTVFREPYSYTGENSIEISFHGNAIISKIIFRLLLEQNVRLAEPGEFTMRAFLNNKIDLIQAEAVSSLIRSRSDIALKEARSQLDGFLSEKILSIKNKLFDFFGLIELEIDFIEDEYEFVNKTELIKQVKFIQKDIRYLLNSYSCGKMVFDGINVGIIGRPNVGKSSLLNLLLKEERAIVSEIPGTTRDIIKEEIILSGILFKFYDTAGIHNSKNKIEEEGIKRAYQVSKNSDIIILMYDNTNYLDAGVYENFNIKDKYVINVLNKIDLISSNFKDINNDMIPISVKKEIGLDLLINRLIEFAETKGVYTESGSLITTERQRLCLFNADGYLTDIITSLFHNRSPELVALDLRLVINCLREIIGEITDDDILNHIFSSFCIGK